MHKALLRNLLGVRAYDLELSWRPWRHNGDYFVELKLMRTRLDGGNDRAMN